MMCDIIIVDDDKLIREDVKTIVEWEKYGFRIIGESNNGMDAIGLIDSNHVDIVITDIDMPILNGIELIRNVKSNHPHIKFLVISNYDDFCFVKEAMKLGASDYILKYEIEKDNLILLLENLKNEIIEENRRKNDEMNKVIIHEKAQTFLVEQFFRDVLHGNVIKGEITEQAAKLGIDTREGNYVMLQIDLFHKDVLQREDENLENDADLSEFPIMVEQVFQDAKAGYVIPVLKNRWVVLLKYAEKSCTFLRNAGLLAAGRLQEAIRRNGNLESVVTLGHIGMSLDELHGGHVKVKRAAKDRFYRGVDIVIELMDFRDFASECDEAQLAEYKDSILHSLGMNDKEGVVKWLAELSNHIFHKRYHPDLVYGFYIDLLLEFGRFARERGINIKDIDNVSTSAYKRFGILVTLYGITDYFIVLAGNITRFGLNPLPQNSRIEVVKAIEFIGRTYMNDMSLSLVAEHVGLSKNYFCRLFKDETGENFIDYLNKFRMEKAKFLIETTSFRTVEIANMVGIKDYRYFCKVFKQITGRQTNEFKKRTRSTNV